MKTRVRLPYPALLVLAMATTLVAGPAGAILYMHETPGTELVGIRLSFMAAPVGGANQTGSSSELHGWSASATNSARGAMKSSKRAHG